jgi:hypothetical protein
MSKVSDGLKSLYFKMTGKTATGTTAGAVLEEIATDYVKPADGENGADGISVTSIALTTDTNGAVTGGTVTYSDETTSEITVTVSSGT